MLGFLPGDGQHLLDRLGVLGVMVGREAEEGVDRSEVGVAGGATFLGRVLWAVSLLFGGDRGPRP